MRELANAMLRGDWLLTTDAIGFNTRGELINGQHRLSAIVESGLTFRFFVAEGVDDRTLQVLDTGTPRTLPELLQTRQEINTQWLAGMLRLLYRIRTNAMRGYPDGLRPTHQQHLELLASEPALRDFVLRGRSVWMHTGLSISVAGTYWYVFSQIDEAAATGFFERLQSGIGMTVGDPVYALRSTLERRRQMPKRPSQQAYAGLVIHAWNAYRAGHVLERVAYRRSDPFPEIDGIPIDDADEELALVP